MLHRRWRILLVFGFRVLSPELGVLRHGRRRHEGVLSVVRVRLRRHVVSRLVITRVIITGNVLKDRIRGVVVGVVS